MDDIERSDQSQPKETYSYLQIKVTESQKRRVRQLADAYGLTLNKFLVLGIEHLLETRPTLTVRPNKELLADGELSSSR